MGGSKELRGPAPMSGRNTGFADSCLVLHTERRLIPLGICENESAHKPSGNYPSYSPYQLLHRIYNARIAVWYDQLQKLQNNGATQDKNANGRGSGIGYGKQE